MTISTRRGNVGGYVLVAALVIGAVVGISLLGYLSWASTQNRMIMRSQAWNEALPMAEAGLEEAMTHLKRSPVLRWENGWVLQDGWFTKTRTLGGGYFTARIQPTLFPDIIAEGFVKAPLHDDQYISRRVLVTTTNMPTYFGAIVSDKQIDLNGNNVYVDSFDSANPLYSKAGQYDPALRRDNATIASNLGLTDSLNVGNANVFGKVATAPGGSVRVGPAGAAGSIAWQEAGNTGLQPGWVSSDFNLPLEPVPPPATTGMVPAGGTAGLISYDYVLTDGVWELSQLKGTIYVAGNAVLLVKEPIAFGSGKENLVIAEGASLKLWAFGSTTTLNAKAIDNQSGNADAFHYYGTENNTSINVSGNVKWDVVLNAPMADLLIGGGGSQKINVCGAVIAKSVSLTGRIDLHFDEALMRKYWRGYTVTSWTEL